MFDPLQIPNVWRAQSLTALSSTLPTGFDSLNTALGGGWPSLALLQILTNIHGIGEIRAPSLGKRLTDPDGADEAGHERILRTLDAAIFDVLSLDRGSKIIPHLIVLHIIKHANAKGTA